MTSKVRLWVAGVALAAVGVLLYSAGTGDAGKGGPEDEVTKIAAALKKGDKAGAEKMANAYAKKLEELHEVMDLFKTQKKGGYKIAGLKESEGIESHLRVVARDAPKAAGGMYEEIGNVTGAIALIAQAKAPAKDMGKKLKKDWVQWSKDMGEAAAELAQAKGATAVKTAAAKVNASCNNCHAVYRQ